ncbi:hypothetical protein CBOM_03466 [Ceraceosorus bombacis]|uniref:Uncharacterized protein n=1 Tax=Ceraceosorus bombacis TaxID=401625 RepID=A0A0P1BLV9_9BASI|nr:hypothetical protein CBOM_03466 [Ceraceosorus bombacis]
MLPSPSLKTAIDKMDIDEELKAVLKAMPEPLKDRQEPLAEKSFCNAVTGIQKAGVEMVQRMIMRAIFERKRKVTKAEEDLAKREAVKAREAKAYA